MTTTRYHRLELGHYGMAQRWLVVSSQAAYERAESAVTKACHRESEAIAKQLFHLQAKRFETPVAAQAALAALAQSWRYHQVETATLIEHKRYAGKGRPTSTTPMKATAWQMQVQVRPDDEPMRHRTQHHACFVLGTNIAASQLRDPESHCGLQSPSPGRRRFSVSQRPAVLCLVVVCEKTLSDSRLADGDDVGFAGLFRDATPAAPAVGTPRQDGAQPDQPADGVADLALGLPATRRDSSRPRDRARPVARPH